MDLKLNTLQYLTVPGILKQINHQDKKLSQSDDIAFYKKRIYITTKSLLKKKKINSSVNDAFNNYAMTLIEHFKIIDTNDIIQDEFKNTQNNINICDNEPDKTVVEIETEANSFIINEKPDVNEGTLNNFVKIVKTSVKAPMIIPKQKNINLKDNHLRNKGIKIKNKR
jgi:hypothetical protein